VVIRIDKWLNQIIEGDCLEVMKEIPEKSVDMILCDLPYGTTACKWDTIIPFEPLWEQYERVIKDNGAIVLTACQPFTSALVMSNAKLFRYEWCWKKNPVGFLNAKRMPLKDKEDVCVFYKKLPTYNPQGVVRVDLVVANGRSLRERIGEKGLATHNGGRLRGAHKQEYTNYPRQVITFQQDGDGLHPTQKPVALFEYLIRTYTNEGETVLDNCAGSFTTAVACDNTNRNWICIEKEEEYCNIGLTRVNDNRERLSLPLLNSINSTIVV
jgi:site-specific DNA-methyltransferase (adenine-specific)